MEQLRKDANYIIEKAIAEVLPNRAVKKALANYDLNFEGNLYLVSIGKAAYEMAKSALEITESKLSKGIVITKYDHAKGTLSKCDIYEAGHPVPDENTLIATGKAVEMVSNLRKEDRVIFLVSGGGSALFEDSYIALDELQDITNQLLASGAEITEINTIRKRLSKVKGGRFAKLCEPASVYLIVLSDVLGDKLDVIASGPAYPDSSTVSDALEIIEKYKISVGDEVREYLLLETPKEINNVETVITGSVRELCKAAEKAANELGYETVFLTDSLNCEAKLAGKDIAKEALKYKENSCLEKRKAEANISNSNEETTSGPFADSTDSNGRKIALIAGGETVVHLTGKGKGGRNQELALSTAGLIDGKSIAIFSVGSDGTDGPTDAAGGYVDGDSFSLLNKKGIDLDEILEDNNSYEALKEIGGLIVTGPTGTNVNDLTVALVL